MLSVGMKEMSLVRYLVGQLLLSDDDRIDALRNFVPAAEPSDWETIVAGQRVQVIRPTGGRSGVLGFDTTVLNSADGSIAGLLGASPGASTAVHDMLDVLERCFSDRYQSWRAEAQGHGAVAGHQAVRRASAVRGSVGLDDEGVGR